MQENAEKETCEAESINAQQNNYMTVSHARHSDICFCERSLGTMFSRFILIRLIGCQQGSCSGLFQRLLACIVQLVLADLRAHSLFDES